MTGSYAQEIIQHVRGTVFDSQTRQPLAGATIVLAGADSLGTAALDDGTFQMESVRVGRYRLRVSYTGYTPQQEEVLVIAGKETTVEILLTRAATQLSEVTVTADVPQTLPGTQVLTIEKTMRVPANFFDPVRVATSYPGVATASDQNNAIIVRGNSPNGLLWRLNGLDIVNPNHLSNAGTLSDKPAANGGGVNILSAQMLGRTQFLLGALPTQYGNATAGVVDMQLRDGNRAQREYTAQASLIGLDLATEGPLSKNKNSSYLANYRYSTVGVLSAMGVDFGGEAITFQDFSFNLSFQNKKGGKTSVFGLGGLSSNKFEAKEAADREQDKDSYNIDYAAQTGAVGVTHSQAIGGGYLAAGVSYSGSSQEREAEIDDSKIATNQYDYDREIISGFVRFTHQLGETSSVDIGANVSYSDDNYYDYTLSPNFAVNPVFCPQCLANTTAGNVAGTMLQPYLNLIMDVFDKVTLTAGIRYVRFTYNESSSAEPRLNFQFRPTTKATIDLAYGRGSQQQQPWVYLAANNSNLEFTRTDNINLRYQQQLKRDIKFSLQGFYQHFFDVPVSTNANSTYSTVNLMETDALPNLINNGTALNYGADLLLEKSFFGNAYFWIGASVYNATYTAADERRYDSRFSGGYTFTTVYGKEWLKPARQRTIALNARLLYFGGMRENPIDLDASRAAYTTVYDMSDPNSVKLGDYARVDFRISFRKDKPGYTRTFAIDIQNLAGIENDAYHAYDFHTDKVELRKQLGIIPVIVYRIDF